MKTLHKIGIVTLALSSLFLSGCGLASLGTTAGVAGGTAADAIGTFGNWGIRILWVYFVVELVRTIGSMSHPSGEGTVGSAAMSGFGDWLKKRAKRAMMTEVTAEKEALVEWKLLNELRREIQSGTSTLDSIRRKLNSEVREERRFKRRVDRVVKSSEDFIAELEKNGDQAHADRVKEILKEVKHDTAVAESLSNILMLLMAKGGKFECCLEKKNFNKGSAPAPADHKNYTTMYGGSGAPALADHKRDLGDLIDAAIDTDAALVAKIKELVAYSKKVIGS